MVEILFKRTLIFSIINSRALIGFIIPKRSLIGLFFTQEDSHWWQAYREGEENSLAGLIPSPSFHSQVLSFFYPTFPTILICLLNSEKLRQVNVDGRMCQPTKVTQIKECYVAFLGQLDIVFMLKNIFWVNNGLYIFNFKKPNLFIE